MLSCRKMKTCCTMGEKERGSEKEIVLSGILPISVQRFYTNKRQYVWEILYIRNGQKIDNFLFMRHTV